jgi:outer membrane protein
MKKLLSALLACVAFAGISSSAIAQPAAKIAVVDMAKLLDDHHETQEQNNKLKADETRANEELEKLNQEGNVLVEELRALEERGKNPALSNDARAKLETDTRAKIEEIQRKQQEVQSFRGNTQRSLQQRIQNFRKILFDRLSGTVADVAKKKGVTLVIDKSGFTHIGLNPVVYSDPAYDITAEVQAEINKGRPAGTITRTPAAPAAPAAQADDSRVTFPGAK